MQLKQANNASGLTPMESHVLALVQYLHPVKRHWRGFYACAHCLRPVSQATKNPTTNPISTSTTPKNFKSPDGRVGLVADLRSNSCLCLLFFIMCLGAVAISGRYRPWLQSNLYISIASGPGPTMLLERLCI